MRSVPSIIEVDSLTFGYNRNDPILHQIGFSVARGEFVALIGANGTGKSTLLRLLLGELAPNSGSIRLFGRAVSAFKEWARVGYVPQVNRHSGTSFPATVEEIVSANLYAQIGPFRPLGKQHREKVRGALALVGMEGYAKRLIGQLSGGQQQRVMLARVLVSNPEVMLLDEPTNGVDGKTVASLLELLSSLHREKGLTVLMVTHDIGRTVDYASKILCLEENSLVELTPEQMRHELTYRHTHGPAEKIPEV